MSLLRNDKKQPTGVKSFLIEIAHVHCISIEECHQCSGLPSEYVGGVRMEFIKWLFSNGAKNVDDVI